jgi:hypothetical protein
MQAEEQHWQNRDERGPLKVFCLDKMVQEFDCLFKIPEGFVLRPAID